MKLIKRITILFTTLVLTVATFLGGQATLSAFNLHTVKASGITIDNSSVVNDLGDINIYDYPKKIDGNPYIIRFIEYCYSNKPLLAESYGLYVYLYNPTQQDVDFYIYTPKLKIATSYDDKGNPLSYEDLELEFKGKTDGEMINRFYKFKITNPSKILIEQKKLVNNVGYRRYDLVGVQLRFSGGDYLTPTDYPVARTLYYTGYASGCGDNQNAESTLKCEYKNLDTLQLNVGHTNYRFDKTDGTAEFIGYELYDDLSSVYFSVPEEYFTNYGALQKIKAQWYEYKTKPIFVTNDSYAYQFLLANRRQELSKINWKEYLSGVPYRVFWERNGVTLSKVLNAYTGFPSLANGLIYGKDIGSLHYIFYDNVDKASDYKISRDELMTYIQNYSRSYILNQFPDPTVNAINKYSKYLFENSIDKDRLKYLEDENAQNGLVIEEFDAGENQSLEKIKDPTFWEKLFGIFKTEQINYSPIVVVDNKDFVSKKPYKDLNNEEKIKANAFCEKYYINITDYDSVMESFYNSIEKNERFVLFRFAVTDYYTSTAFFDQISDWVDDVFPDNNGYVAQETVFLDFDIISLTFRKEGVDTVIGVVSDPFDIINGLDPPSNLGDNDNDLWKLIIGLILGLAALIIIWPFVSPFISFVITLVLKGFGFIFKGVITVITLPFKTVKKRRRK